jgi:putative CocE/NonD family hydrolase
VRGQPGTPDLGTTPLRTATRIRRPFPGPRPSCLAGLLAVCALACAAAAQSASGPPPVRANSVHDPAEYTGQYSWNADPDIVMSVYLEDGHLYEEREGKRRQEAFPDEGGAADRFALRATAAHLVFVRGPSGAVTGCNLVADASGRTLEEETRIGDHGVRVSHYREYDREEVMIPMRDGVKLHTVILRPTSETGEPLPFLMQRTPYGIDDYDSESVNLVQPELAASGYLFVFQDIRGRYKSEGSFVMNRPIVPHNGSADVDETTDVHDTIDWLLKNVLNNNGRVGVKGVSYDGFLAMMAGIDGHPALKAISPQAPMTDVWMGDDFFHNGAFRQSYGFDYVQQMEAQKIDVPVNSKEDTYDFFLHHGNFAGAAAAAKMTNLPTAKAFLTQPTYTNFWREMAVQYHLQDVTVPTLEVGGYWDQEDMWGTQAEYAALQPHDAQHQIYLVLGPWNHGGWDGFTGRRLGSNFGRIDLGQPTGIQFRKQMEVPFFEKYLKDRPGFNLAGAASFRTGANQWQHYAAWPPPPDAAFAPARLYLGRAGALSFDPPPQPSSNASPASTAIAATYKSDPANPIPYRHRPIQSTYALGSKWYTWLVEDQRFVSDRPDLANFETAVLDRDVTIAGEVTADLFASTTGSDADWVVKLIDEYPPETSPAPSAPPASGFQLMVAEEIFRARYLHSFEQPQPLKTGEVDEFKWSLHAADHTFLKGHRIMVEVQSTWFPLYDRNPQTFVANIMSAPAKAYKAQTMSIYASPKYPSHLEIELAK